MANRLINELTLLALGDVENADWLEIQETDSPSSKKVTVEAVTKIERDLRIAQDDTIEASVGLDTDGSYDAPVGSNYMDGSTDVMDALLDLDTAIGASGSAIVVGTAAVSAANLNNAGVAPFQIIAAPGAAKYIELISCSIHLYHNGTDVDCGTQKLIMEYDTGATHFMEWAEAFVESSAAVTNKGTWTSEVEMMLNKKIQLTFDSGVNPTAGNSTLSVWYTYIVREIAP